MNAFTIGISTLAAGQRGLDLVGQNIANASTPGYHRQSLNLVDRTSDGVNGSGVDVAYLTRYTAPPVRSAILTSNADQAAAAARLGAQQQVETALGASPNTIGDGIESFFNQVEQLTAHPDDQAVRQTVLGTASDLAGRFQTAADQIDQLRNNLGGQVSQTVDQVNKLTTQIAGLNQKIAISVGEGQQPNDLMDQRDQLIDQLSQQVDVRTVDQPNGVVNVMSGSAVMVVGEYANQFTVSPNASGNLVVSQAGVAQPVTFGSGTLAGQIQAYNQDIPAVRSRLDTLANTLIQKTNAVQATGLPTSGPMSSATGSVSVPDPTTPLAGQNLPFPAQAGTLVISVTDTTSGTRTNNSIAIDPASQSLNDIAAAITAGTGGQVQATVDPTSNTLKLNAQSGFQFDFAGRDTNPPGGGAVANPDTAGILPALGINGLFTGSGASGIKLNSTLSANPQFLAAGTTGQPGDATNLEKLAAVRDQTSINGRTLGNEYADLAATVGGNIQNLGDVQTAQTGLLQNLNAQEQSVSGVDTNEELVHLMDYQRMVEAGSKYLTTVNTALDSIMQMVS